MWENISSVAIGVIRCRLSSFGACATIKQISESLYSLLADREFYCEMSLSGDVPLGLHPNVCSEEMCLSRIANVDILEYLHVRPNL